MVLLSIVKFWLLLLCVSVLSRLLCMMFVIGSGIDVVLFVFSVRWIFFSLSCVLKCVGL